MFSFFAVPSVRLSIKTVSIVRSSENATVPSSFPFRIHPRKSGVFRCRACTERHQVIRSVSECSQAEVDFFLVEPEFESGFEVLGPRHLFEGRGEAEAGEGEGGAGKSGVVVERDNVSLTCGASVYDYFSVEWFKENGGGGLEAVGDDLVRKEERNFTHVAALELGAAKTEDTGKYVCRAEPIRKRMPKKEEEEEEESDNTRSYSLEVWEIIVPR